MAIPWRSEEEEHRIAVGREAMSALGGGKVCPQSQNSGLPPYPPFRLVLHQLNRKPEDFGGPCFSSCWNHRALQGPDRGKGDTRGKQKICTGWKTDCSIHSKQVQLPKPTLQGNPIIFLFQEDNLKSFFFFFKIFEIKIYSSNLDFLFTPLPDCPIYLPRVTEREIT